MFNLSDRFRLQNQPCDATGNAASDIRLTGTQASIRDALIDALRGASTCIMLTGAAGAGKTTVLAAALSCVVEPERQVLRLDEAEGGMEEAFRMLFASQQRPRRKQSGNRRLVLALDHAEGKPPGSFAYLELLSRMPGKAMPIQWVFVGRSEPWNCLDGPALAWLREVSPARLALPALSEQDAWELFHRRVSSTASRRSTTKLIATLLEQSQGLPGRFDAVVGAAVAAGLLQGIPVQAA